MFSYFCYLVIIVTQSNKTKHLAEHNSISMAEEHMALGPGHYTLGTQYLYAISPLFYEGINV